MNQLSTERLQQLVVVAMQDLKARDIQQIDVQGVASFTECMIFASGTSNRHVKSIAQSVIDASTQAGMPPLGVEGDDIGDWILVDLGDVVVHVMLPETREFYDIERLWLDETGQSVAS